MAAADGDATAAIAAKLHRKTSIPSPPEPYIAHPYTLLQSRELVGRQAELNALTDWVANPASPAFDARVFCFVAIGGMGKSALTWKWFDQVAPNEMKPLAGRLWWSFYESDADFENFLIRALCYVGGETEEAVRALPWLEREARLLQHLKEKRYLFVLDGLERILISYRRMDASYLADDEYSDQPTNRLTGVGGPPASAACSFVGRHRLRETTDPRAGVFLRKLPYVTRSRILITSRLYPTPLQMPSGRPRSGCFVYFLQGLNDDDALALWRALEVQGSRAELVPVFRSVEGHPLLVQTLTSEIANYRRAPGDFMRWRMDHPEFEPTCLPLVQSRTHILEFALRNLSMNIREVLHTLAAFRKSASYASLEALLVGPDKTCKTVKDLDRALTELADRGLVGWDRGANRYDAHPIVRGVIWQFTGTADRKAVFAALATHFGGMAPVEWPKVNTLADLTPAIECYRALISLGRYDDACKLFFDRLDRATMWHLAANLERITLLEQLFLNGVTNLPELKDQRLQYMTLNSLAFSYYYSGGPYRSLLLFRRSIERSDRKEAYILTNFSLALRETGALREALAFLKYSLIRSRETQERRNEGFASQNIGCLFSTARIEDRELDQIALRRSLRLFAGEPSRQFESYSCGRLSECSVQRRDIIQAAYWADRSWELARATNSAWCLGEAALTQGLTALAQGNLNGADGHLHNALSRGRTLNLVHLELSGLIAIAEMKLKQGLLANAKAHLDDVWDIAEHGPYVLRQADAYNVLTDIALAEGNKQAAIDAATNAYRAAWCDGPPYAYHWGLEKAKAHLAAFGAPEPDMPPFDESKFEPMPEIEINPKDQYWVDPDRLD